MTMDTEFYQRRMAEERAAAAAATTDPVVRDRHKELADLYAERLKGISKRRTRPMKLLIDNAPV